MHIFSSYYKIHGLVGGPLRKELVVGWASKHGLRPEPQGPAFVTFLGWAPVAFLTVCLVAGSLGWVGSNPDFGDGANPSIVWLHF